MLKKLGRTMTVAYGIAFAVVLLVGGISIFFTQNILQNAYMVEKLSRDIVTIDSIHADAYRLVLALHHFLIDPDELYSAEVKSSIANLKGKVEAYKEEELKELDPKQNREIALLDTILKDIRELRGIEILMEDFSKTGTIDRSGLMEFEDFAYEIEEMTNKINLIHFDRITQSIEKSLKNMWMILFIYLLFVTIGVMSIYVGHRALLRNVVGPIKELASATIDFAGGKLDTRVYTNSQTEIGQLYQSFNQMADRIQENDEVMRKFNVALEQKVRERTHELMKTNEQLGRTQNALIRTEKVAAIGQIAAGVTHEVKNPLNSLSINTQKLLKELSSKFGTDASAYEAASLIRYEINRINNILEEFVKFAKFPEPDFYDNNLNIVIEEVRDVILSGAEDLNIKIKLSLQEDIPDFKFDARQFKEVLLNLFQNAMMAMKEGGELAIRTSTMDDNVIIEVADTGNGIPEKNLDKVFTPFFSTKEGGLGLGLPIVQRIVESHNGRVMCTSKVGEGTRFEITIPLDRG